MLFRWNHIQKITSTDHHIFIVRISCDRLNKRISAIAGSSFSRIHHFIIYTMHWLIKLMSWAINCEWFLHRVKSDFQQIPSSTFEKKETKKNTCQTTSTNNKNYNTYGASLIVHINRTEMKKEKKKITRRSKKSIGEPQLIKARCVVWLKIKICNANLKKKKRFRNSNEKKMIRK